LPSSPPAFPSSRRAALLGCALAVAAPGWAQTPGGDIGALLRAADAALAHNPAPLAVIHVEGTLPTVPAYQRAMQARQDWNALAVLAASFALRRERQYLDGYGRYLAAWLDVYRISGNPIDETGLGDWLLAFRAAGADLPTGLAGRMRQFAADLATRYTQAQPGNRKTSTNNWQSHRAKLAVMGARAGGDASLVARAESVFARQIADNLLPGGETVDFAERDALHYVVYSLEPLLEAALFSQLSGQSLFQRAGPQGQCLSRSLAWLAPFARGEQTHEEFVHSTVRFDAQRAAAGVAGFAGPFLPHAAQRTYWLAARLDAQWQPLSDQLGKPWITQRIGWMV